jgi:hypothetical protein
MYVIKHKDGGYLRIKSDGNWERIASLGKASQMTHEKATNFHRNSISPAFRAVWSVVDYERERAECSGQEYKNYEFDWYGLSDSQNKLYAELQHYGLLLKDRLSEVDLEICDIQHYIEFFSLDAAKGYKAYRMLKERLKRRREIKDEMARANLFLAGTASDFSTGKVSRQLKTVDTSSYQPRILSELFGLDEGQKKIAHVS